MSTDHSEIRAYRWQILAGLVLFGLGFLAEFQTNLSTRIQALWDVSKRPCIGKLKIVHPRNGDMVKGVLVDVIGSLEKSESCTQIVVIVEPLSGPRSRFVSDVQQIHDGQWLATARIDSIPIGGPFRITARMCPESMPYPKVGCIQDPPMFGVASNTVKLIRIE